MAPQTKCGIFSRRLEMSLPMTAKDVFFDEQLRKYKKDNRIIPEDLKFRFEGEWAGLPTIQQDKFEVKARRYEEGFKIFYREAKTKYPRENMSEEQWDRIVRSEWNNFTWVTRGSYAKKAEKEKSLERALNKGHPKKKAQTTKQPATISEFDQLQHFLNSKREEEPGLLIEVENSFPPLPEYPPNPTDVKSRHLASSAWRQENLKFYTKKNAKKSLDYIKDKMTVVWNGMSEPQKSPYFHPEIRKKIKQQHFQRIDRCLMAYIAAVENRNPLPPTTSTQNPNPLLGYQKNPNTMTEHQQGMPYPNQNPSMSKPILGRRDPRYEHLKSVSFKNMARVNLTSPYSSARVNPTTIPEDMKRSSMAPVSKTRPPITRPQDLTPITFPNALGIKEPFSEYDFRMEDNENIQPSLGLSPDYPLAPVLNDLRSNHFTNIGLKY